jgi:hypothetical protein
MKTLKTRSQQDAENNRREANKRNKFVTDTLYCVTCGGMSQWDGMGCSGCETTGLVPCPMGEVK